MRVATPMLLLMVIALVGAAPAQGRGLLLFDTCVSTERFAYEHPAFHVMRPDGTRFRTLREWRIRRYSTLGCPVGEPSWAPDGSRIVFRRGAAIAVGGPRLRGVRRIHPRGFWPAWSPTGKRIAFETVSDDGRNNWLMTVRPDGRRARVLLDPPGLVGLVRWHPGGRRLVFHTFGGGGHRLWSVRADGGGLRDLGPGQTPDYSPSGRRIAFAHVGGLWTMRSDGSDRRVVVPAEPDGMVERVAWSPDGRRIAYIAEEAGDSIASFIRVVRAGGGRPRQLDLPGNLCCPINLRWQPR